MPVSLNRSKAHNGSFSVIVQNRPTAFSEWQYLSMKERGHTWNVGHHIETIQKHSHGTKWYRKITPEGSILFDTKAHDKTFFRRCLDQTISGVHQHNEAFLRAHASLSVN